MRAQRIDFKYLRPRTSPIAPPIPENKLLFVSFEIIFEIKLFYY